MSRECRLRGCVCHKCGKKNHVATVCKQATGKSKTYNTKYSRGQKHNYVSGVQPSGRDVGLEESDDNLDGVANLYEIGSSVKLSNINSLRVDPHHVNTLARPTLGTILLGMVKFKVNIEGQNIVMELDTGASVSMCSKGFYQNNLKHSNYYCLICH